MGLWINKMLEALSGGGAKASGRQAVRDALLAIQHARGKIALEAIGGGQSTVATTLIEQVGEYEIIIGQPNVGGLTHPLAFGEVLHISFIVDRRHHTGETRCLGRVKIPNGAGGQPLYAYKLAIPEALRIEERRADERPPLDPELAVEAAIFEAGETKPAVTGTLAELTMNGARVRTAAAVRAIVPGQEAYLKMQLPEPVGMIDEVVDISHIGPEKRSPNTLVGLTFRRKIETLEALLRDAAEAA